ncbi:MAG TPA: hypothetical protein VGB45_02195 [Abditibacterium sp.]|jgi:hypothetical protein
MNRISVPSAPSGKVASPSAATPQLAAPQSSPLDAAFLRRAYVSLVVSGVLFSFLAAFGWSGAFLGSFIGGYVLAVVMLKLQEGAVRGLLRPTKELGGLDPKLGLLLLLPLKFVVIGAVLVGFNMSGYLRPIPMAAGFFAAQLVILAKLAGWYLTRRLKN